MDVSDLLWKIKGLISERMWQRDKYHTIDFRWNDCNLIQKYSLSLSHCIGGIDFSSIRQWKLEVSPLFGKILRDFIWRSSLKGYVSFLLTDFWIFVHLDTWASKELDILYRIPVSRAFGSASEFEIMTSGHWVVHCCTLSLSPRWTWRQIISANSQRWMNTKTI